MSITFTGTGGLFTRLGRIAGWLRSINRFRGAGSIPVTTISGNGTTITVTCTFPHGFHAGDTVIIAGSNIAGYNGSKLIASISSATVFTITDSTTGANTAKVTVRLSLSSSSPIPVQALADNIEAQFQSTNQDLVEYVYASRDSYRNTHDGQVSYLQQLAQKVVIQMVDDDVKLASKDITSAMTIVISQMVTGGQTVQKPTLTAIAVTAGGSNNGDAVCQATYTGNNGVQQDYVFTENISVKCTTDSQGFGTLGSETFSVVGSAAARNQLDWSFPAGSGANTSITATDAQLNASGNVLTNSSFNAFTVANTPDNWSIVVGTPGTTIFSDSGNAYQGANCLKIAGNGAELTALTQTFALSTGTLSTLLPSTTYGLNVRLKVSSVPGAGVMEINLIDGSNNVINDAAGTANTLTQALTALTTSYTAKNTFFRTPTVLPPTVKLRIRFTTALSNTVNLFIDNLALVKATQVYTGGPFIAVHAGATKTVLNDVYTIAASSADDSGWQTMAEQLFNMRSLGLQLPSGGSPTIADTLIS